MVLAVVWSALVLQRLLELKLAKRNTQQLLKRGAVEVGAAHYPVMVLLHSSWFASWLVEGWGQPVVWWWKLPASLVILGQFLRLTSIWTLGERWTTRVLVLPKEPSIQKGLYRWIPHPNYLGVCLELGAVPLIFGAWRTAIFFSLANGLLLWWRIGVEDRALGTIGSRESLDGR